MPAPSIEKLTCVTVIECDGELVGIDMVVDGTELCLFADQTIPGIRLGHIVDPIDESRTRRQTITVLPVTVT
jgi:hypothetical protein